MLFNSTVFIFLFLPIVLAGYGVLSRCAPRRVAIAWLVGCSLLYYGWWEPRYLILIASSIAVNFNVGLWIQRVTRPGWRRIALAAGILFNLLLLGYFKYANFFVEAVTAVLDLSCVLSTITLPLAISFFTFQQIAYLVDTFRGKAREGRFLDYCLFVTFFPQLIAGPIVHHQEMMSQFTRRRGYRLNTVDLSIGLTTFAIGLAKKVLIADHIARWSTPIFSIAEAGGAPTFLEAWAAVFAYSAQIYFDFSGYSDMAIGLGRCFGIRLSLNFNAPYKAANIVSFWRRWHITLSRFLRDYLYISLGGNRRGTARRYLNLMLTMLLGGLWHGAGWTFIAWGGLHGLYLMIYHGWESLRRKLGRTSRSSGRFGRIAGCGVTFLAVSVAWVFFRAADFDAAFAFLRSMSGRHGIEWTSRIDMSNDELWFIFVALLIWVGPTTQQIMGRIRRPIGAPALKDRPSWQWRPAPIWSWLTACLFLYTLWYIASESSEFIYYQF